MCRMTTPSPLCSPSAVRPSQIHFRKDFASAKSRLTANPYRRLFVKDGSHSAEDRVQTRVLICNLPVFPAFPTRHASRFHLDFGQDTIMLKDVYLHPKLRP